MGPRVPEPLPALAFSFERAPAAATLNFAGRAPPAALPAVVLSFRGGSIQNQGESVSIIVGTWDRRRRTWSISSAKGDSAALSCF